MAKKLELGKKAGGDENPDLQNMLGGGEQPNGGENPTEGSENPNDNEQQAPEAPKAPEAPAKPAKKADHPATVTFYTRVGDPFDSKTGKERPVRKHVVTYAEWLRIKDRLARLGYNLVKVEE